MQDYSILDWLINSYFFMTESDQARYLLHLDTLQSLDLKQLDML